ncbi:MAG: hypothetical protein FWG30_10630 [Eubacteriaceae bacterium]|jgi:hypothetical protein|nr:hypothetical protein [Eubacteriaceae bacterium]
MEDLEGQIDGLIEIEELGWHSGTALFLGNSAGGKQDKGAYRPNTYLASA